MYFCRSIFPIKLKFVHSTKHVETTKVRLHELSRMWGVFKSPYANTNMSGGVKKQNYIAALRAI